MTLHKGFIWWGSEYKRKLEVKRICRPCGPFRGGFGIQISLILFHFWIAILR
jgi:hypothetical protein